MKTYVHTKTSFIYQCTCSFIHNSKKLEITQMSINRWMDIQILAYPFQWNIYSMEQTIYICNMNEFQKHYAGWKKPDRKGYTIWIYLYKTLDKAKPIHRVRKYISGCLGWRLPGVEVARGGLGTWFARVQGNILGVMVFSLYLVLNHSTKSHG